MQKNHANLVRLLKMNRHAKISAASTARVITPSKSHTPY